MSKDNELDFECLKKLLSLVDNNNLEELTVEDNKIKISIKGKNHSELPKPVNYVYQEQFTAENYTETTENEDVTDDSSVFSVISPLVGTFYTSQAPDMPPYVSVGDKVSVGTELGLIEAMKVFSPIPSEVAGEIISINAKSGDLIKKGDVIMKIRIS